MHSSSSPSLFASFSQLFPDLVLWKEGCTREVVVLPEKAGITKHVHPMHPFEAVVQPALTNIPGNIQDEAPAGDAISGASEHGCHWDNVFFFF